MDELKRNELVSYALVDELAMFLRTSGKSSGWWRKWKRRRPCVCIIAAKCFTPTS